jgi:murein DD-endopeptidase MepM/ murein hydrolase activator NlpD
MSHHSRSHHGHGDAHKPIQGGQRHDDYVDRAPARYDHRDDLGHNDEPARHHGNAPQRQRGATRGRHASRPKDFTLTHAGKLVRLGPVAFWTIVGTLVIMAGWSIITATYFAFHDDVLARLIAREASMQFAYEDRIAEMRMQVDRVTSRQMLDQEQLEQKLEQLRRRQSLLEARTATLGSMVDPVTTGSIRPATRGSNSGDSTSASMPKSSPINDTVIYSTPIDREARLETRGTLPLRGGTTAETASADGMLARLQDSLDRVETRQSNALNALERGYDSKASRIREALSDLGLDPGRVDVSAMGGPFVPAKPPESNGFERQIYRVNLARAQLDRLNRTLAAVPVRKPVTSEIDMTSGFGVRIDPFVNRPAMHTGLDFRGNIGDPVRATASGTVTHAGWAGGYGNMVEVDHGNGLSTRYGHLSEIEANVGQTIRTGQVIGRLGSSGRSTGPHLHYETRVDGEAVDPERFLRAGLRAGAS